MAFIQFLCNTMSDQSELRMTYVSHGFLIRTLHLNSICLTTPTDVLHLCDAITYAKEKASYVHIKMTEQCIDIAY